jgi:uncharacterized protein
LLYVVSALVVLGLSGLMSMAGLGVAFLVVPLLSWMGVPLSEAASTGLLLNAISLSFATITYWRAGLVNVAVGAPVGVAAIVGAPIGARLAPHVPKTGLLALFAAFLVFAGAMMLFYRRAAGSRSIPRSAELGMGAGVGGAAGVLGGLLGVGGGNLILPVLHLYGLEAKVAAGTTALAVVFSSLSGFLGRVSVGSLDVPLVVVCSVAAAIGSLVGSRVMASRVSTIQLKQLIAVLLWVVAASILIGLL